MRIRDRLACHEELHPAHSAQPSAALFEQLEARLLLSGESSLSYQPFSPLANEVQVEAEAALPDLYVMSKDSTNWFDPDVIALEDVWEAHFDIGNREAGDAGDFYVDFYVSTDDEITTADYHVGSVLISGLPAWTRTGADLYESSFSADPAPLPDGEYYVGVLVDADDSVPETDETNNTGVDLDDYPLKVSSLANLYVVAEESTNWFDPDVVELGEEWEAHFEIGNKGSGDAGEFYVDFYISTDDEITAADYHVGEVLISGLLAKTQTVVDLYQSGLSTNPADLPDGEYYVGVLVDAADSVAESDETNNTGVDGDGYPLTVIRRSDLYVIDEASTSWFDPDVIALEDAWEAHFDIGNKGRGHSGYFYVAFYVSADDVITTEDYYVGYAWMSGLAPGAQVSASIYQSSFPTIPADIPDGEYYVGVLVDADEREAESDETNNTGVDRDDYPLKVSSLANLYVVDEDSTNWCDPNVVALGEEWEAHFSIGNKGIEDAGDFYVDFYVSADDEITTADYYVGQAWISGLAARTQTDADLYLLEFSTDPADIPGGDYYVGVLVDAADSVPEADESDNAGVDRDGYPLTLGGVVGDVNGDGFVGQGDLDIVLGVWGQSVPPADPRADLTGDGAVGQGDLDRILANWGSGALVPAVTHWAASAGDASQLTVAVEEATTQSVSALGPTHPVMRDEFGPLGRQSAARSDLSGLNRQAHAEPMAYSWTGQQAWRQLRHETAKPAVVVDVIADSPKRAAGRLEAVVAKAERSVPVRMARRRSTRRAPAGQSGKRAPRRVATLAVWSAALVDPVDILDVLPAAGR